VDLTADLVTPASPETLFTWVDDLTRYPSWLEIVTAAVRAEARPGDPGDAWTVTLRGRLGPFSRSKRLRMVRTELHAPQRVRFERREDDGREHSSWVLEADVHPEPDGASRLVMVLHYGGGVFEPLVEHLLRDEIDRSKTKLLALVG
jgi:hypothetical protein